MLHRFLLTALVALLLAPTLAAAQGAQPVGTVSTGDDEVARSFSNPDVTFDALSGVMAFGQVHDDPQAASGTIRSFPVVFAASIAAELEAEGEAGFTIGELEDVTLPTIGDQSAAHRVPFTMFGAFEGEYGMLLVRQDRWVQVLLGFGIGEVDTLADLQALAQQMLPRWPNTDPIAVREDGLRTGGIWAMMPNPEDLPPGHVVDETFEEGPGPTTDQIVPVGTAPATQLPVGIPTTPQAPDGPPRRDLPLLPTLPPDTPAQPTEEIAIPSPAATEEEIVIPEPQATVPPAEATMPTAPTPASINPRLAGPFDLAVEIILPLASAEVTPAGTCQGTGLLAGLATGGALTLQEAETGQPAVTATIDAPGRITYDTEQREEVCYLTATFTDVPPRAAYTLLAGESVLGRYTYEEVTAEETLLVVLGDNGA